jgi:hypothetical protein
VSLVFCRMDSKLEKSVHNFFVFTDEIGSLIVKQSFEQHGTISNFSDFRTFTDPRYDFSWNKFSGEMRSYETPSGYGDEREEDPLLRDISFVQRLDSNNTCTIIIMMMEDRHYAAANESERISKIKEVYAAAIFLNNTGRGRKFIFVYPNNEVASGAAYLLEHEEVNAFVLPISGKDDLSEDRIEYLNSLLHSYATRCHLMTLQQERKLESQLAKYLWTNIFFYLAITAVREQELGVSNIRAREILSCKPDAVLMELVGRLCKTTNEMRDLFTDEQIKKIMYISSRIGRIYGKVGYQLVENA